MHFRYVQTKAKQINKCQVRVANACWESEGAHSIWPGREGLTEEELQEPRLRRMMVHSRHRLLRIYWSHW